MTIFEYATNKSKRGFSYLKPRFNLLISIRIKYEFYYFQFFLPNLPF